MRWPTGAVCDECDDSGGYGDGDDKDSVRVSSEGLGDILRVMTSAAVNVVSILVMMITLV